MLQHALVDPDGLRIAIGERLDDTFDLRAFQVALVAVGESGHEAYRQHGFLLLRGHGLHGLGAAAPLARHATAVFAAFEPTLLPTLPLHNLLFEPLDHLEDRRLQGVIAASRVNVGAGHGQVH